MMAKAGHGNISPIDDEEVDFEEEEPLAKKRNVSPGSASDSTKPDKGKVRLAHSTAEKKRRDAIKESYNNLADSLTGVCEEEKKKLTRGEIMELAYNRSMALRSDIENKRCERNLLQKKLSALQVIAEAYDAMPKTSEKSSIPPDLNCVVSNNIKLKLFTTIMLKQFESFSGVVNTDNLQTLASSLFYWVEVHWRPVDLRDYLIGLLKVLRNRFVHKSGNNPSPAAQPGSTSNMLMSPSLNY